MMTPMYRTLNEIKETESFDKLESFKDSTIWAQMTTEERDLLARLLVMQGARDLAKGNCKVLENFSLATQVSASAEIFYEQGLVFGSYEENIRCLTWANQAFLQATEKNPSFIGAWYRWAQTLMKLGLVDGEGNYFIEANQKFEKVFQLLDNQTLVAKIDFYWHWGNCLFALGKHSGEPIDFYKAIHYYQLAAELGCKDANFFIDYGRARVDLALLLERPDLLIEAVDLFNQAVKLAPTNFEGWYQQACCLHRLSEISSHEEYLQQAQFSFTKAVEIDPSSSQLWLKWGQLEATIGKLKRDQKRIESAIDKLTKANQLEPDHPVVLSTLGEIELFLGSNQDCLDLIQSAKLKIIKSLEIQPDSSDGWYLYGACLNELGRYFDTEEFYYQAIEKFQYGLSLSRQNPLLWYGLALAHFAIGELTDELSMFEKAIRHCSRVIECGGGVFAQFWNDWGVALMKMAEMTNQKSYVEAAIEKFEHALKQPIFDLDGEDIDLEWIYNYGCAFDLLGDLTDESCYFEKAILILGQVVQLDPSYTHARYNLALSFSHLAEASSDIEYYNKALEQFQIILNENAEDELAQMDLGISLVNLALLVQDAHQPERAQMLYKQAEQHFVHSIALGNCQAYYQLAGLYSLIGDYTHAMHAIERAQFFGALPLVEDLMHDTWLDGLRQTPSFRQFLNHLSSQQSQDDK